MHYFLMVVKSSCYITNYYKEKKLQSAVWFFQIGECGNSLWMRWAFGSRDSSIFAFISSIAKAVFIAVLFLLELLSSRISWAKEREMNVQCHPREEKWDSSSHGIKRTVDLKSGTWLQLSLLPPLSCFWTSLSLSIVRMKTRFSPGGYEG